MLKSLTLVAVSIVIVTSDGTAQTLIDGSDPSAVLDVARGWGSASLDVTDAGNPRITGRHEGLEYYVGFYGCNDGRNCTSIQLRAGFSKSGITVKDMNEWNLNKRFGKASLNARGGSWVKYDINLEDGVTRANLDDSFSLWLNAILGQFTEHIGWNQD